MKFQGRISLAKEIQNLVETKFVNSVVAGKFLRRLQEGNLTRDENPLTHFGVYFAGFDQKIKKVFVGLHKKSDLWLFNGGHIDQGELLRETLAREMEEEWGFVHPEAETLDPSLLTITEITSEKQICRLHYDIWYFIPVNKVNFSPDKSKLAKEFHKIKWVSFAEARKTITDSNTLMALNKIVSVATPPY